MTRAAPSAAEVAEAARSTAIDHVRVPNTKFERGSRLIWCRREPRESFRHTESAEQQTCPAAMSLLA